MIFWYVTLGNFSCNLSRNKIARQIARNIGYRNSTIRLNKYNVHDNLSMFTVLYVNESLRLTQYIFQAKTQTLLLVELEKYRCTCPLIADAFMQGYYPHLSAKIFINTNGTVQNAQLSITQLLNSTDLYNYWNI
jgi:hypothetical protein